MRLRDAGTGDRLALTLVGYQFAQVTDFWDSNWLRIEVEGCLDGRTWSTVDPCLDTFEVEALARWLSAAADGSADPTRLDFTEPNLCFELVEVQPECVRLRVWLGLEARPPWARKGFVGSPELAIELAVSPQDLRAAASDLLDELRRFPTRVEAPPRGR